MNNLSPAMENAIRSMSPRYADPETPIPLYTRHVVCEYGRSHRHRRVAFIIALSEPTPERFKQIMEDEAAHQRRLYNCQKFRVYVTTEDDEDTILYSLPDPA